MIPLEELHVVIRCPSGLSDAEADDIRSETLRSLRRWAEETTVAAEGRFKITVEP